MGKIVISENVSLNGVVQDPTGEEGFRHGGWFGQVGGKDREEWAKVEFEEALGAEALLLGRRSDEYFGPRWTGRSGEWADKLNGLPKYVVSSTLVNPEWSNSTVLKGDVVEEVSKLKQELDGDIVVYRLGSDRGSPNHGRTLLSKRVMAQIRSVSWAAPATAAPAPAPRTFPRKRPTQLRQTFPRRRRPATPT